MFVQLCLLFRPLAKAFFSVQTDLFPFPPQAIALALLYVNIPLVVALETNKDIFLNFETFLNSESTVRQRPFLA